METSWWNQFDEAHFSHEKPEESSELVQSASWQCSGLAGIQLDGLMWKGFICFFIRQHLEPFCFHPSILHSRHNYDIILLLLSLLPVLGKLLKFNQTVERNSLRSHGIDIYLMFNWLRLFVFLLWSWCVKYNLQREEENKIKKEDKQLPQTKYTNTSKFRTRR